MKKILAVSFLAILISGCISAKKQKNPLEDIANPHVIVKPGSVVTISVENMFIYDAKDVCIDICKDGEIVVTFTEVSTGNRCSVWGDVQVVNLSESEWKVRDYSRE
jgi:hypothetical protein